MCLVLRHRYMPVPGDGCAAYLAAGGLLTRHELINIDIDGALEGAYRNVSLSWANPSGDGSSAFVTRDGGEATLLARYVLGERSCSITRIRFFETDEQTANLTTKCTCSRSLSHAPARGAVIALMVSATWHGRFMSCSVAGGNGINSGDPTFGGLVGATGGYANCTGRSAAALDPTARPAVVLWPSVVVFTSEVPNVPYGRLLRCTRSHRAPFHRCAGLGRRTAD